MPLPSPRHAQSPRNVRAILACAVALSLGACVRPAMHAEPSPIASDRPSFSTGTSIAEVGHPLLEIGTTYSRTDGANVLVVGEPTLRVGLSPRIELRLTAPNYLMVRPDAIRADGLGDAGIAAKVTLLAIPDGASRIHPHLSLLAGTSLPTGSETFGSDRALPSASLIAGWALSDRVGLGANLIWGQADVGGGTADTYAAVAGISVSHTDRFGSFTELYSTRGPSADWDPASLQYGVTYLLRPSLQLDGHAGVRLKDTSEGYFLGFGLTRRF
ncbi:MAG: transporter [Gemmatimonadetes bacterium]|nr:transporter [Gemmatimonadota bacterium]